MRGRRNDATPARSLDNLVPEERLIQRYDLPVLNNDGPPGGHAPVMLVIVADYLKGAFIGAFDSIVLQFLGLDIGAEILLPVLKPDRDICRPAGAPEEIVVVAVPLSTVHLRYSAEAHPLPLEADHIIVRRPPDTRV